MSGAARDVGALRRLARLHGVQHSYTGVDGTRRAASAEVLVAVLRALGVPVSGTAGAADALRAAQAQRAHTVVEPVLVHRQGPQPRGHAEIVVPEDADPWVELRPEGGEPVRRRLRELRTGAAEHHAADGRVLARHRIDLGRFGTLVPGYHRLVVDLGAVPAEATVVAAPARCPAGRRSWGIVAPLYAVRGPDDWGTGSFTDLGRLADWVVQLGGGVAGTLPLYAAFLEGPRADHSPYRPASRLAWNEAFLDVAALPDLAGSPAASAALADPEVRNRVEQLRTSQQCSLPGVLAAKRRVLEPLADSFFALAPGSPRRRAFAAWADAHPEAIAYAGFRARLERGAERSGPAAAAPAAAPAVTPVATRGTARPPAGALAYHLYAQFAADEQLGAAARRAALYLDLPVGVHPAGFDPVWAPGTFVSGASCGAPPDDFFAGGQVWGLPPLHPEGSRASGHAHLAAVLRHAMRHAAVVRLDHVMGLHRMWFVPDGASPADGAYVTYRAEELRAVAVLEASRSGTSLVGEDLGTVPDTVRRAMRVDGMLRTSVWQFGATPADPVPAPPADAVASLGTHDTVPFAAVVDPSPPGGPNGGPPGRHGPEPAAAHRRVAWQAALGPTVAGALRQVLVQLAASPARVVLVELGDLWLERDPQNRPGTADAANFRLRARRTLDELRADPEVASLLAAVDRARRTAVAQVARS